MFSWPHKLYAYLCNRWFFFGRVQYVNMDSENPTAIFTTESKLPKPAPESVRMVILSDTHLYHRTLCVPFGDVLIHAGDFLAEWGHGENEFLDFLAWLKQLPHQKKMVTAGNHDRIVEALGPVRAAELFSTAGAVYLHPEVTELETVLGLRFAGAPWSLRTNPLSRNGAFQAQDSEDERFSYVPSCDILVTHGPPRGAWAKKVLQKRPRLHVFGHDHEKYGVTFGDGMVSINAALCNDFFCATRSPVVVDFR